MRTQRKPTLYFPEETSFITNGIGVLSDAVSVTVTEELNGSFELEMVYPTQGMYFGYITYRSLILAQPNNVDEPQPFRVYRISKPMNGRITVYAEHISYDLCGIQVSPFTAPNVVEALYRIRANAVTDFPFTLDTDKTTIASLETKLPQSARACLLGADGSVLDVYGGEYKFDGYSVRLLNRRGADRGFTISYGVNLVDLKQEQSCADTYTGIYPYYYNSEKEKLYELPEKIVNAAGDFGYTKIKSVDLTSYFEEAPTTEELREAAEQYVEDNNIGVPTVSLDVSFEQLWQSEEYKSASFLREVELGDTVRVRFERLGISAEASCTKTVYDALSFKYKSVSIGDVHRNIADSFTTLENTVRQSTSRLGEGVARIEATTKDNEAKIGLLVVNIDGENVVSGAVLVEAINDQSQVLIKADKINLEGYVTATALAAGDAVIDGSGIKAGSISADKINSDGLFVSEVISVGDNGGVYVKNGKIELPIGSIGSGLGGVTVTPVNGIEIEAFDGSSTQLRYDGFYVNGTKFLEWATDDLETYLTKPLYIRGSNGLLLGDVSHRTEYGALAIETDREGANNAAMILNASDKRNNIFFGSWDFASGEPSYGSDRSIKKNVRELDARYGDFFDRLSPRAFEYIDGNSGRTHVGFIAQEAYAALEPAGLTSQDFAGICIRDEGKETELWTVRAGEFLGLCIDEVQKLKKRVAELEARLDGSN